MCQQGTQFTGCTPCPYRGGHERFGWLEGEEVGAAGVDDEASAKGAAAEEEPVGELFAACEGELDSPTTAVDLESG